MMLYHTIYSQLFVIFLIEYTGKAKNKQSVEFLAVCE